MKAINYNSVRRYYDSELSEIPHHKMRYLLVSGREVLLGAFGGILHYGYERSQLGELFPVFFDAVSAKLSDNPDVEYEFNEKEYDGLMWVKECCGLAKVVMVNCSF